MSEQRQYDLRQRGVIPGPEDSESSGAAEPLETARAQLDRIYAAADSILDDIRLGNSEEFLARVRQSGGE